MSGSPELGILQVGTDAAGLGFDSSAAAYPTTILDNFERLDPRSLQHQGRNALRLPDTSVPCRWMGQIGSTALPSSPSTSCPGRHLLPFYVGSAAGRSGRIALGRCPGLRHLARTAEAKQLSPGLLALCRKPGGHSGGYGARLEGRCCSQPCLPSVDGRSYYGADWRLLFLTSLTVAFVAALYLLARRFIERLGTRRELRRGVSRPYNAAVLTSLLVPSFSYLFSWPALAGVLVLAFGVLIPVRAQDGWPRVAVLAIAAFVPVLFAPPIYILYAFLASPAAGPRPVWCRPWRWCSSLDINARRAAGAPALLPR